MNKLTDIRNALLKAIELGCKTEAKWAINDLDTYISKKQNCISCGTKTTSDPLCDVCNCRGIEAYEQ